MKKKIEKMKKGERIYINAINCSVGMIEQLRSYIKNGVLIPDENELEFIVIAESIPKFMNGTYIAPQMTYIKA